MNQEAKIEVYKESYARLKENSFVYNLQYPAEKKHFEYNFNIGGVIAKVIINSKEDMMKCEMSKEFEDISEKEIFAMAEEISEDVEGMRFTAYDQKAIFLINVIVTGKDDISAKTLMNSRIDEFVEFIVKHFGEEPRKYEVIEEQPSEVKEDNENKAEEVSTEANDSDSVEIEENSNTPNDIAAEKNTNEDSSNAEEAKEEIKEEVIVEEKKEETVSKEDEYISNLGFTMPVRTSKPIERPSFSANSVDEKQDNNSINTSTDDASESHINENMVSSECESSSLTSDEEKLEKELNSVNPETDEPELVQYTERMKRMYEDLNKVTKWRQEQLDCREHICKEVEEALNKEKKEFAEFKANKERELDELIEEAKLEYEIKKEENDKRELDLNLKEKDIEIQYQNMELKKQTIEDMERVFEKRKEELLAKESEINSNITNIEHTEASNEEYSIQVAKMQDYINTLEDNMNKYEEDLTNFEKSLEQINELFKTSKAEWDKKESEYNSIIAKTNSNLESNRVSQDEITKLTEMLKKAEEEKDNLKRDNEDLHSDIISKKERIDELQTALDNTSNTQGLIVRDANRIKELLAAKEINVDFAPGAGELMLNGTKDEVNIVINTELKIIYLEKNVKKANRYIINISKLNQQDIRTTFFIDKEKICCKFIYKTIEEEIPELLKKYSVFI